MCDAAAAAACVMLRIRRISVLEAETQRGPAAHNNDEAALNQADGHAC